MSARISAPARMRVDGTLVPLTAASRLNVVHVGQSAVVLRASSELELADELLILTSGQSGLMPGGVCLQRKDFRGIRHEILSLGPSAGMVQLDRWFGVSTAIEPVDLVLSASTISLRSALAHDRALRRQSTFASTPEVMSPGPLRRRGSDIARQAIARNIKTETLRSTVGAGPGTTPSGDDVIVGVLAGLHTLGLHEQAATLSRRVMPLLPQTTLASRHYLTAASQGRFGEHVHHLVDMLADGGSAEQTLQDARRWGATSGVDLLVGLVSTLTTSMGYGSIESAA